MSGSFNIEAARKAGYSDAEIAPFLATQHGFDINAARKAGYDDGEITSFLATVPVKSENAKTGEQMAAAPVWTEAGPDAAVPQTRGPQGQVSADINAVGQGLVGGAGSLIAGAGRIAQAGVGPSAQRVLAALDLVDQGKNRDAYQKLSDSERQQVGAYRGSTPEDRAMQRAELLQDIQDYEKPNMAVRAGMAVQGAAPKMFPVEAENEGIQTSAGRLIGGVVPALAGGAIGGAPGLLASLAVIGSQAYDTTYQEATAKGATHEAADDAAGKSALAQAATMAAPVGRLLQRVPLPMRDGLMATLVNLGKHGVEFGSANAVGTFANNYVASQTYDPGRPLTQGTGDAALEGAIAGLIIPAVGGLARGRGATVDDVMKAPDVDGAIAAASEASRVPSPEAGPQPASRYGDAPAFVPSETAPLSLPRILSLINEDSRIAANRPDFVPPDAKQPSIPASWGDLFAPRAPEPTPAAADALPEAVGAAASRQGTPAGQIDMAPAEFAANRLQGEVERLASPPKPNDKTIYIPGTQPTLAEITGDPRAAIDQKYNRQQPEAMQQHIEQENRNAEAVANYYADTAGSAQELQRMEAARSTRADQNIQRVFGDPQASRPPADLTPTIKLMGNILSDPRQAERNAVVKILDGLTDKFYDADGNIKTDPYALYGIGEHINDLLRGVGDTETNSAARVLKRELMQIKESLYNAIERAAPGFAQYRTEYQRDSREIDAMKLLQDERLALLNKDQHLTPAKFFTFMKNIVMGRADPMDPASSLSEDQMDRLWNITDQLKRSTFIDAGSPRGSPTSMLQEWGKRAGVVVAHGAALHFAPVVGNIAVKMGGDVMRARSVRNEMNRVLNPDLGQQAGP